MDQRIKLICPPQFEALKGDNAQQSQRYNYYSMPSLGMGIIAATLRRAGHVVEQADLTVFAKELNILGSLYLYDYWEQTPEMLRRGKASGSVKAMVDLLVARTEVKGFDCICFSILSFGHFLFALLMSAEIRRLTHTPIVFGGAFITLFGHLYPDAFDHMDYMVVGDGREALLSLLENRNNVVVTDEIPNLLFRRNNRLISTRFESLALDTMPLPDFMGLPIEKYRNSVNGDLVLPYQMTRGCFYKCNFCVRPPTEKVFECKDPKQVVEEMRRLKQIYGEFVFALCDSNIGFSREYLDQVLEHIIQANLGIRWRSYMDVRAMDHKIALKMRKSGCDALMFGVESGSDRILDMISKQQTAKQAADALKCATQAGIETTAYFISGYPHETSEDIQDTINFIKNNNSYITSSAVRTFFIVYGSYIYHSPLKYNVADLKSQECRYLYTFNEMGGMSWKEKIIQQARSKQLIAEALSKYL